MNIIKCTEAFMVSLMELLELLNLLVNIIALSVKIADKKQKKN